MERKIKLPFFKRFISLFAFSCLLILATRYLILTAQTIWPFLSYKPNLQATLKKEFSSLPNIPITEILSEPTKIPWLKKHNLELISSSNLGPDTNNSLVLKIKKQDKVFNLGLCDFSKNNFDHTLIKKTLRRIGSLTRHTKDNWVIACNLKFTVFDPSYRKFIFVSRVVHKNQGQGLSSNLNFLTQQFLNVFFRKDQLFIFYATPEIKTY